MDVTYRVLTGSQKPKATEYQAIQLDKDRNEVRRLAIPLDVRAWRIRIDGITHDQCQVSGDTWYYCPL